jgi:hypothetical protein
MNKFHQLVGGILVYIFVVTRILILTVTQKAQILQTLLLGILFKMLSCSYNPAHPLVFDFHNILHINPLDGFGILLFYIIEHWEWSGLDKTG